MKRSHATDRRGKNEKPRLEGRGALGALLRAAPEYTLAIAEDELTYGATFFFHAPIALPIHR